MANDRGLEGPADARLVEAPAGLTPLELRAAEDARRAMIEHLGKNPVLSMDQLVEMKDLRPQIEKEFKLPNDERGSRNRVYYFSINGTLNGTSYRHCLLAGECIVVQSDKGFEHALRLAKDGLATTLELAREYYDQINRSIVVASPVEQSMVVDVGGRRAGAGQPDLATDPKLRAMIAHKIGGKPWKG